MPLWVIHLKVVKENFENDWDIKVCESEQKYNIFKKIIEKTY